MKIKNPLLMIMLAVTIGLVGCAEKQEASTEDAKQETMEAATDVEAKSEDMLAEGEDKVEAIKEDADSAMKEAEQKAETAEEDAAAKLKEKCIEAAEKLGQSTDKC
ncbi:hypothetical protein [Glaciecola petra]|uniref:Late embryogenesis abundant protein n=1 Tax=Glaciecola petra TaxID=3075602 RepID=A0ABU2ZQR6_9ALTE|nr:hypothetical protein [Aestuariibacter sp. P117]MDT0593944.1 hypothetical protein [Aestuariibacter sp. P117]